MSDTLLVFDRAESFLCSRTCVRLIWAELPVDCGSDLTDAAIPSASLAAQSLQIGTLLVQGHCREKMSISISA